MSDFSAWGPQSSGPRLAEVDQRAIEAHQVKQQQDLMTLAGQPDVNRLHAAQAAKAEFEVANQRKMQDLLAKRAQGEVGKTVDLATQLEEIASMSLGAGLITQGEQTAKAAGYVRGKVAQVDNFISTQRKSVLAADKAKLESIAALAGGVTDQDSWDRANALYQFNHGTASPYAGLPYSPAMVEQIRTGAISAAKQVDLQLKAEDNAGKERNRQSAEALRSTREDALKLTGRIAREREDRLAKAGGGGRTPTTPREDIDQATRLIQKDFPKLDATQEAASTIASEAQLLLRRNPALDRASAVQQAYNAAKLRGDFQEEKSNWLLGSDKQTFKRDRGTAANNPLPFPEGGKGLEVGKFYINPKGVVGKMQANGKLVKVNPTAAAARSTLPLSPDNTDGNDNEPDDDEPDDDKDD